MRNKTFHLDNAQIEVAETATYLLKKYDGQAVTFEYTKRDGTVSMRQGRVMSWHGAVMSSTGSVRMDTPDGERVFNLWGMRQIHAVTS